MPELLDPTEIFFTAFEPKTQNRFIWYIEGMPSFIVKAGNRPSPSSDATEIHHMNGNRKLKSGKTTWNDITLTLYDPIVPSAAQAVMEWFRLQHESVTGRDGYSDFYKKDITLNLVGPPGDKIEEWTIKGAFITSYEPGALDWSVGDPIESTVTLAYDYAILQY